MLHITTRPQGQSIPSFNFKEHSKRIGQNDSIHSPIVGLSSSVVENEEAVLNLAHWLSNSELFGELNYVVDRTETNTHRIILKFKLSEKYASWFVTLRALFSFGKSSLLTVSTNRNSQIFSVNVISNDAQRTNAYFENITTWLIKEIRFKETLRKVREWETQKKAEELLTYRDLISLKR